jgi:TPR repeat protein
MRPHATLAEQHGQLDPQSLAVQSVGVLIGSPSFLAGKLPWSLSNMESSVKEKFGDAAYEYGRGNFAAAAVLFAQLVAAGHAPSATYFSQLYLRGEGVPVDPDKAVELLEKGILCGDWNAAWNLAAAYYSGHHGLPRDRAKGQQYFLKAKELGCTIPINAYMGDHG